MSIDYNNRHMILRDEDMLLYNVNIIHDMCHDFHPSSNLTRIQDCKRYISQTIAQIAQGGGGNIKKSITQKGGMLTYYDRRLSTLGRNNQNVVDKYKA